MQTNKIQWKRILKYIIIKMLKDKKKTLKTVSYKRHISGQVTYCAECENRILNLKVDMQ